MFKCRLARQITACDVRSDLRKATRWIFIASRDDGEDDPCSLVLQHSVELLFFCAVICSICSDFFLTTLVSYTPFWLFMPSPRVVSKCVFVMFLTCIFSINYFHFSLFHISGRCWVDRLVKFYIVRAGNINRHFRIIVMLNCSYLNDQEKGVPRSNILLVTS